MLSRLTDCVDTGITVILCGAPASIIRNCLSPACFEIEVSTDERAADWMALAFGLRGGLCKRGSNIRLDSIARALRKRHNESQLAHPYPVNGGGHSCRRRIRSLCRQSESFQQL